MPDVKELVAEPSAAPASPEHIDLATLTPEDRQVWRDTGEIPERPKKAEPAPPDPLKAGQPEPKGEKPAEPGAAQPQKDHKTGKLTAEQRIAQLTREKKELEERLRTRESAPQPAAKTEPAKTEPETPKRPDPFTWKGTPEEYGTAMDAWEAHQRAQAIAEFQRSEQAKTAEAQMKTQMEDAKQRYSDFESIIKPAVEELFAHAKDIPVVVQSALNRSPHITDVLYVLGGDKEALADFISTAKTDSVAAIQKLFFIEQEVARELEKSKTEPAKSEKPEPAKEARPESKEKPSAAPQTRAPKPVSEVGGRGTAPDDPALAAVNRDDFRGAKHEWNRRAQEGRLR